MWCIYRCCCSSSGLGRRGLRSNPYNPARKRGGGAIDYEHEHRFTEQEYDIAFPYPSILGYRANVSRLLASLRDAI
jgi:hypothetical protein